MMVILEKALFSVNPGLTCEPDFFVSQRFRCRQNYSASCLVGDTKNYARINLPVARDCLMADGKAASE